MKQIITKASSESDSGHHKPRASSAVRFPTSIKPPFSMGEPQRVQRKASCACGGGCPRCRNASPVHPAVTVSSPGDWLEQEADHIAEQVLRMPAPKSLSDGAKGAPIPIIQRQVAAGSNLAPTLPALNNLLPPSGARPLAQSTRDFFEPRFNYDFSGVRVHTGAEAAKLAVAIDAQAYTIGREIVFGAGHYAPETGDGRKLLAHELAHVVQQGKQLTSLQISRQVEARGGDNVSAVDISCGTNTINFYTRSGVFTYTLDECALTDGEYEATVDLRGTEVRFTLAAEEEQEERAFHFIYRLDPGQPNPRTFFRGQRQVRIVAHSGDSEEPVVLFELPIEFVADPMTLSLGAMPSFGLTMPSPGLMPSAGLGAPTGSLGTGTSPPALSFGTPGSLLTSGGLSLHVLASGDLSWLSSTEAARRVLSREYWSPFVPSRGTVTLDRVLNALPRDLAPRIESQLANGETLSWVRRGFTETELRSIPELVRRLNAGEALASQELAMLRRAAEIHIGGTTPGAPLVSYTRPNFEIGWGQERNYRVRVEMPRGSVLDVSRPNAFNQGIEALTNPQEMEWLAVANHEGRIVSVQRAAPQTDGVTRASGLMRYSGAIRWGGRLLFVAGAGMSVYRIATAEEHERPVVVAEEGGGMVGGALGTAAAVAGCVLLGIATGGVGLFVCGLVGGVVGGVAGSSLSGEFVRELRDASGTPCPSCHAKQRQWEAQRSFSSLSGLRYELGSTAFGQPLSAGGRASGTAPLTSEEIEIIRQWLQER